MQIKKSKIVIVIIIALLIGFLFFLIFKKDESKTKDEQKEKTAEKQQPEKSKKISDTDADESPPPPFSHLSKRQWEKMKMIIEAGIASNKPIDFYGKVVDQFDTPVEGAEVTIWAKKYNDSGWREFNAQSDINTTHTILTDTNGLFNLKLAKGNSIWVEKISKEGYRQISSSYRGYYGTEDDKSLQFDPANPIIYKILNVGETEPLYKGRLKSYDINSDGTGYFIDLKKRKFQATQTPDSKLIIAITKLEDKREDQKGDFKWNWRYSLKTIDGGIIEVDKQNYIAPDSGYEEEASFATDVLDKVEDNITKSYILQDKEGRFYLIKLEVLYWENDRYLVEVEYYLNPKPGSRNLSYDSLKALRRWPEK